MKRKLERHVWMDSEMEDEGIEVEGREAVREKCRCRKESEKEYK